MPTGEFIKMILFGTILAFCGFLAILMGIDCFLERRLLSAALMFTIGYSLLTFRVKCSYKIDFDFSDEEEDDIDE